MATYRNQQKKREFESDSSDSSDGDSDDDQPWKRKQHIPPLPKIQTANPTFGKPPPQQHGSKRRKTNNIWGQVVQEQNEEFIFRDMTHVGVEMEKERDVESYDYKHVEKENKVQLGQPIDVSDSGDVRGRRQQPGLGASEDDKWLVESDTKSDVRERLGRRQDLSEKEQREFDHEQFGSKMRLNMNISDKMSTKEVAGKIAYSLQEPKRDVIKKVVRVLGIEKAVELWEKTRDVEKSGGMMIMTGARRRTPGGVFFTLMKKDPDITKAEVDEIFSEERQEYTKKKHERDRRKRRSKKYGMEVDGEDGGKEDNERGEQGDMSSGDEAGGSIEDIKNENLGGTDRLEQDETMKTDNESEGHFGLSSLFKTESSEEPSSTFSSSISRSIKTEKEDFIDSSIQQQHTVKVEEDPFGSSVQSSIKVKIEDKELEEGEISD